MILTTPPNARADIVETLAASGKPILMEKPVERTLEAATALVETCEAHAVPLGIMPQHRARPAAADLRAVSVQLGELLAVEDGRRSLEFVTAVYASARAGVPQTLPLDGSHPLYEGWTP